MSIPRTSQKDLHLLTMNTPNGQKVQIALEELKLIYQTDFSFEIIDITTGQQKQDWFLKLNPNGRIPTLIDHHEKSIEDPNSPFTIMESAAILLYLAKKVDKDHIFGFTDPLERSQALQWIFFGMAGVGPMQGQLNHFNKYAPEKLPYAIQRYHDETLRLYGVLESKLSGQFTGLKKDYLVGKAQGKYSWADIAIYPWVKLYEYSGITQDELDKHQHLKAWLTRISERPAVQTGSSSKYSLPK